MQYPPSPFENLSFSLVQTTGLDVVKVYMPAGSSPKAPQPRYRVLLRSPLRVDDP
jgi:hypothetical protein